ncbi:thioesterase family protein [Terasakiella sp. A23]|uniref:acyl-CoA thioesterase n=1 Tax=Terasakiella sp. FCG-A23 TaxID=3080561 RepID=UPI002954F4FD|nr:thioesterase family protein [Terasakiella sp. A23]MDV7341232.1 thioesterase family protein [Terasakiella sp. A23]
MSNKPTPNARVDYAHFSTVPTRWMDNDVYGHVNNVNYYSYFDTAVNKHLIDEGALDIHNSEVIGLVVETRCNYFASITFPQNVEAGIRVTKIGKSSVRYEIGLFIEGSEQAAAQGHFIHVYVERATQKPTPLPEKLQSVVTALFKETE